MTVARLSVLLVIAAGILFGTAGTAQALGPGQSAPLAVGILRIQVGAVALLATMPFAGASPRQLPAMWRTPPMIVTALTAATYQLCFFAGVSLAGVALGTLVAVGSAPVFAGLVGWVVLGHRPTASWAVATAVCVTGLVLLAAPDIVAGGSPLGLLLALGAGLCIAGYNVAAKRQLDLGVTPLGVSAGSFVLGGLLLVPVLATQSLAWLAQPSGVAMALYLGVATMSPTSCWPGGSGASAPARSRPSCSPTLSSRRSLACSSWARRWRRRPSLGWAWCWAGCSCRP
jgi:DME family drug/metabolite transporter